MLIAANPFMQAYTHADFLGKLIFFSLFLLSILSWTVLLYKIYLIAKIKKESSSFKMLFDQKKEQPFSLKEQGNYATSAHNAFFSIYKSVKKKTLEILEKNRYFLEKESKGIIYLSDNDLDLVEIDAFAAISEELKKMEKHLFILPTTVSLGPFLGLLGTVWGMLMTFSSFESSLSTTNSAVLSGLSMALATTVLGLIVAIPALIAKNYLKSTITEFSKEMEQFSHALLTTIDMQYRKVESNR